jgi:8-oxo-dGTP pyrophosphatase MutT (NUDIX family)
MTDQPSPWVTHSSEISFENPWFKVRTDQVTTPGGQPGIYGVIEIPPPVHVMAFNDKQEFCLVREFRYPHQKWMWGLPGGTIGPEDTDPLRSAQRELAQETGFTSEQWSYMGSVRGVKGLAKQIVHVCVARDVVPGQSSIEHDEAIEGQRFISLADFYEEIRQDLIDDEETIAAVMLVAVKLKLI